MKKKEEEKIYGEVSNAALWGWMGAIQLTAHSGYFSKNLYTNLLEKSDTRRPHSLYFLAHI